VGGFFLVIETRATSIESRLVRELTPGVQRKPRGGFVYPPFARTPSIEDSLPPPLGQQGLWRRVMKNIVAQIVLIWLNASRFLISSRRDIASMNLPSRNSFFATLLYSFALLPFLESAISNRKPEIFLLTRPVIFAILVPFGGTDSLIINRLRSGKKLSGGLLRPAG